MALEKWLAATSVGLFAMFVGEMLSIYYFMTDVPESFEFAGRRAGAISAVVPLVAVDAGRAAVLERGSDDDRVARHRDPMPEVVDGTRVRCLEVGLLRPVHTVAHKYIRRARCAVGII